MIHGINPGSMVPSFGYALNVSRNGRMSLPVAPTSYIYSQFKHVSGFPAPEGTRGVAISKLKILDVLIEQLSKIKKQDSLSMGAQVSDERLDAMIEQYKTQIRQAKAVSEIIPYAPAPAARTGALFSITA
ncbi:MAG: hypothetical protein LBQ67_00400 [Treponema sp.]|nr:hypothetical protein [Treponema sp.]